MDMRGGAFFGLFGDDQCVGVGSKRWDCFEDNGLGLDVADAISAFVRGDVSVPVVAGWDRADRVEFVFGGVRGVDGGSFGSVDRVIAA